MDQLRQVVFHTDSEEFRKTLDLPLEYLLAMDRILRMLHYPVAPDGTVVDVRFINAVAAYHLARCGLDFVREPLIKRRDVKGPGIIEDACTWVKTNEDNTPLEYRSPLDDVENMTLAEINALPEPLKYVAYQRLGLPCEKPGWNLKPKVNIEDAPDIDDGKEWIRK